MADFGLRTNEYCGTIVTVLDDHTVTLELSVGDLTAREARSAALNGRWTGGKAMVQVDVRLQGLNAPQSPSAAKCVRWKRLTELLPVGAEVLLKTDGSELLPGAEWSGTVWTNQRGAGLPVNMEILLPALTF